MNAKRLVSAIIVVAALLAISIITVNCSPRMFNQDTYPRIDGATAAIPLGEILATELLGISRRNAADFVQFSTTHYAYVNLIEGRADIIFVAEPSEDVLALAAANDVTLKLTPIGMDAFVFMVNEQNSVDGLTVEQIRAIYTGEITNWSEVGGNDAPIMAFQRPRNSGSQTIMENVVMQGLTMMEAPTERRPGIMAGMMDVISDFENAENSLGYNVFFYANEMNRRENIKFLAVNGIPVNHDTIRDGSYIFSGPIYAVTRENDEPENVIQLLEFLLTEQGQRLVEQGGFVPISAAL